MISSIFLHFSFHPISGLLGYILGFVGGYLLFYSYFLGISVLFLFCKGGLLLQGVLSPLLPLSSYTITLSLYPFSSFFLRCYLLSKGARETRLSYFTLSLHQMCIKNSFLLFKPCLIYVKDSQFQRKQTATQNRCIIQIPEYIYISYASPKCAM